MEMCGPFLGVYVFIVRLFCLYTKVVSTLMISYTVIDFPPLLLTRFVPWAGFTLSKPRSQDRPRGHPEL